MRQININEFFERQEDGSTILVRVEETEVDIKTTEEEIAEREAEILRIYQEIQSLRGI